MLKKAGHKVNYLRSSKAIVLTKSQQSLRHLISQRVRWAAKTSNYENKFGKITGIIVLLMNALLLLFPFLLLLGIISLKLFIYILIIKFCLDFLLLFKSARFFEQESALTSYMWSCFVYPFFSVYVAILSVFKGYNWKGRAYRK
jgi:cellulose synthase/poly-beta-1,6-N-acetylglucosamine synthase-like glycosyltransferase